MIKQLKKTKEEETSALPAKSFCSHFFWPMGVGETLAHFFSFIFPVSWNLREKINCQILLVISILIFCSLCWWFAKRILVNFFGGTGHEPKMEFWFWIWSFAFGGLDLGVLILDFGVFILGVWILEFCFWGFGSWSFAFGGLDLGVLILDLGVLILWGWIWSFDLRFWILDFGGLELVLFLWSPQLLKQLVS